MTRDERLLYCKSCTKREASFEKGLLCSLTNEHAAFEGRCLDYEVDEKEKNRIRSLDMASVGDDNIGDPLDAAKNKKTGGMVFLLGLGLTLLSYAYADEANFTILFYGAIIWGGAQYMKGVKQEKVYQAYSDFDKAAKGKEQE